MIKRSFLGFSKSYLNYEKITGKPASPLQVKISSKAIFFLKGDVALADPAWIKPGLKVKTGQRITLGDACDAYTVSTVSGTISSVKGYNGDDGNVWTEITVNTAETEETDTQFQSMTASPDMATALTYLLTVPGAPELSLLADPEKPVHTIVVNGVDKDLLTTTAQHIATEEIRALTAGIHVLKDISGVENIFLAVPRDIIPGYGHIGAELKAVDNRYPAGFPKNIMNEVLGLPVPAGKTCQDMGVCFLGAEAVASIGKAFDTGQIPVYKLITVVDKNGRGTLLSARIGTPIRDIFSTVDITVKEKDRIIFGGPMTGSAVFSEDHPIEPDTDVVLVQDGQDIPFASDYPCINCGECIRVCPVSVPVNMLVRFLEAGQYEEAADMYDLYSCVECGLCSFVCVAKIPIFQYIRLGKLELDRINTAEASNE